MNRSGLLLIERYAASPPTSIGISSQEARKRYRGFDGLLWPGDTVRSVKLRDGFASIADLPRLLAYKADLEGVDVVFCSFLKSPAPDGFRFLGYDLGYFESEYSHYSSLLHEIVFGQVNELMAFAPALNEWLLFDSVTIAQRAAAVRQQVAPFAGALLEDLAEPVEPAAIFSP